jgi:pyruvate/2-oxoglutarate dehydrogenase complex dihydrolipoamide acyltransferase (E2) component
MPKLADTLVEGTVGAWLKQVGETVSRGDALATIETDKVTTELTSPFDGRLVEYLVRPGEPVPIGTPIARMAAAGSVASPDTPDSTRSASSRPAPALPTAPGTAGKPTPVARRILAEHGLRVEDMAPAPGQRVTKAEVLAYVASRSTQPREVVPLSAMRRAIADHMLRSRRTIPHGQCVMAVDLTAVVAWREQHKAAFEAEHGAKPTLTAFFVRALARGLRARGYDNVGIGVAVAVDDGLLVPVVHQADTLDLPAIARGLADLAAGARRGALGLEAMRGALMTVSNVGSFGNLLAAPMVPLDQLGILAPGIVDRRAMALAPAGLIVGWQCLLSLVFDRRAFEPLAAERLLAACATELSWTPGS